MDLFGGGGGQPQKQLDPRMAAIVFIIAIVGAFVLIGDAVTFLREPQNFLEKMIAVVPTLAFYLFDDRLYANAVSAAFYGAIVITISIWVVGFLERRVFKPQQVRKMIADKKFEESLINEAEDRDK